MRLWIDDVYCPTEQLCVIAAVQVATGTARDDAGAEKDSDGVVTLMILPLAINASTRSTATAVAAVGVLT